MTSVWRAQVSTGTLWSQLFLKYLYFSRWASWQSFRKKQYKTISISTRNTLSLRVRIRSGNKGDCLGSRVPVWCVGRRRPAVTGSRSAPPHPGPEPSPPAGASPQGRSRGSSSPSCFYRTWKSETAFKPKRSFQGRCTRNALKTETITFKRCKTQRNLPSLFDNVFTTMGHVVFDELGAGQLDFLWQIGPQLHLVLLSVNQTGQPEHHEQRQNINTWTCKH